LPKIVQQYSELQLMQIILNPILPAIKGFYDLLILVPHCSNNQDY